MSQRRKNKVRKKQPELRTGGGRRAKAERSREREATVARTTEEGPAVRMRPAGAGGMAAMLLLAWLGVALVVVAGLLLDRWNVLGYPDSLWLFVAIGCVVMAPALGRVSRSGRDADSWGLQSLVVPLGLLAAEAIAGPDCPTGASCAAVGARGSLGIAGSVLVVLALAAVTWALARAFYRMSSARRPAQGRVRYGILAAAVLTALVFPGSLLAAALVGSDMLLRDTPELAERAVTEVEHDCFGLKAAPDLVPRATPKGYNPGWTTFAVRRADEDRPGIGKQGLPDDWTNLDFVHPYEATASFNQGQEIVSVTCRRIGPGTGTAAPDDLRQEEPDSNPLSPKTTGAEFLPRFFTQGMAGPSEEAKKQAKADAKAERSGAKDDEPPTAGDDS